jgi:hypothetical protein
LLAEANANESPTFTYEYAIALPATAPRRSICDLVFHLLTWDAAISNAQGAPRNPDTLLIRLGDADDRH